LFSLSYTHFSFFQPSFFFLLLFFSRLAFIQDNNPPALRSACCFPSPPFISCFTFFFSRVSWRPSRPGSSVGLHRKCFQYQEIPKNPLVLKSFSTQDSSRPFFSHTLSFQNNPYNSHRGTPFSFDHSWHSACRSWTVYSRPCSPCHQQPWFDMDYS
jgi:hypothetical protein